MSLGLPAHLAPHVTARSVVRSGQAVAFTYLAAAFAALGTVQMTTPEFTVWPAFLALVPVVAVLHRMWTSRSLLWAIGHIVIGAIAAYGYALTLSSQRGTGTIANVFLVDLPVVALALGGGAGTRAGQIVLWGAAGLVAGEVATGLAKVVATGRWGMDPSPFVWYGVLVLATLVLSTTRATTRLASPVLLRAERGERADALRHAREVRAAALLHDTVLGRLDIIAHLPDGPLPRELRREVARDLQRLDRREWLDPEPAGDGLGVVPYEGVDLASAVRDARKRGLRVSVSGDLPTLELLDRERSHVLGLAVAQCLVNVIRHAGTDRAEVVVYASGAEITTMVVDSGRGFALEATGADRLGLRQSVRGRVESAGGAVAVWSTPGRGTAVMITLPAREPTRDGAVR